tara:strand:+ start:417 stop:1145 length:729 start_codon:yes stop_codon:yes gene_type:complete
MIRKTILLLINFFDYFHKKKILKFLKKKQLNHFPVIFDVGAHKGESIFFFLSNFKVNKIISFEASPLNFAFLKKKEKIFNQRFNDTKIILENIGLGSYKKKVILNQFKESSSSTINEINIESSYFKKKFKLLNFFDKDKISNPIEIGIESLNNYMELNKIETIDFLKIDTEGYEYEILLGLKDKLKSVKLLMFEHHYDNMIKKNYTFNDMHELLISNNFKVIFKAKMPFRKTFEYICINKVY